MKTITLLCLLIISASVQGGSVGSITREKEPKKCEEFRQKIEYWQKSARNYSTGYKNDQIRWYRKKMTEYECEAWSGNIPDWTKQKR